MPMKASNKGVREIIRSAEKQISAGNFERASELLSSARAIEPSNEYIAAIQQRITTLGQSGESAMDAAPMATPDDLANQVRRLTTDARGLYQRGAYQSAFDTLTRAYLLDPVSIDVLQAEALILPAFERMCAQRAGTAARGGRPSASQLIREHLAAGSSQGSSTPASPKAKPPAAHRRSGKAEGGFFARLRKGSPPR